jgi:hypothetical protein
MLSLHAGVYYTNAASESEVMASANLLTQSRNPISVLEYFNNVSCA